MCAWEVFAAPQARYACQPRTDKTGKVHCVQAAAAAVDGQGDYGAAGGGDDVGGKPDLLSWAHRAFEPLPQASQPAHE